MATEANGGKAAAATDMQASQSTVNFLDLPQETQREIVSHCSQADLICLALASKRFHELASAQLYRNFHIVFPDDDDVNFDSPIDGLAGGLDTFTTSEYNYAKHLKDLSMDTLSSGIKGEHSYQPYLYTASCGKFLNTLLHLTLKRAHSLESFRWNIRVELSRPVYAQLHRISSLKRLHLRMQAGDSYYMPPPPLPVTPDHAHVHSHSMGHWSDTLPPLQSMGTQMSNSLPLPGSPPPLGPPPALLPPSSRPTTRSRLGRRDSKDPSTLSGFKSLKSLSVLDIDNLDIIPELQTCMKNSYSTLKELHLSLSDSLAQQARRPPADSDAEDSDADDEFQLVPTTENEPNYDATGPAKVFRAQEEKKLQEMILNRIFSIEEPQLVKKSPMHLRADAQANNTSKSAGKQEGEAALDPRSEFIASMKTVSVKLMASLNGSRDFSISQQDVLDIIEKAARKYVDSGDALTQAKETGDASDKPGTSSIGNNDGPHAISADVPKTENEDTATVAELAGLHISDEEICNKVDGSAVGTERGSTMARQCELSPDDIDIEHLETIEEHIDQFDEQQAVDHAAGQKTRCDRTDSFIPPSICSSGSIQTGHTLDQTSQPTAKNSDDDNGGHVACSKKDYETVVDKLLQLHRLVHTVGQRVLDLRNQRINAGSSMIAHSLDNELAVLNRSAIEVSNEIRILEAEVESMGRTAPSHEAQELKNHMETYARTTRGLAIESLKLCLIPVKASVLSQAIDLTCVKSLTLINVGNQAPIWSMLSKEQKVRPLALRRVFTDHVSASFLTCMAQLPRLDDLFMLERSMKHKPESFAPRTATSIDQIRRLVLKKHMPTLKRLMIKDDSNGPNWDANEKTMILICTKGVQLEELALSMNIHAVHAFMQYFSGLVCLRAINILHFKNNDTCIWVMREILRFIVDNLSHHPEMKLEWIAMEDDRVDRVVRPSESSNEKSTEEPMKRAKDKGKEKAHVPFSMSSTHDFPVLPLDGLDSESDSDDDGMDSGSRLRFKTVGPLQFYDVWGVKIFEKEIRSGKL